jgi:hypothetical protein
MSGGLLGLQTVIFPIITQVVSKAERHLHLHRDSCWRRGFNFGDEHLCHVMKCDRQQCRCRYRYEQLRVQIARAWTRLAVFQLIIYRPTKRTKCQYTFTCASLAETSVKASFLVIAICCAACLRAVDSIFSTKSFGRQRQRRCTGTSDFQRWHQQAPLVKTTNKPARESRFESHHLLGTGLRKSWYQQASVVESMRVLVREDAPSPATDVIESSEHEQGSVTRFQMTLSATSHQKNLPTRRADVQST